MDAGAVNELRRMPFATAIAAATDFSDSGTTAFLHGLALAVALGDGIRFTVLNASEDRRSDMSWEQFPGVRPALESWGLLSPDADRRSVFDALDIIVRKVALSDGEPLRLLENHLLHNPVDLLVLGTEGRRGLPRWLQPSFAERLARRSSAMTLFVPSGADGFLDRDTGRFRLNRILLPADHVPGAQIAVDQAVRLSALVENPTVELTILHIGPDGSAPLLDLPQCFDLSCYVETREGNVAREIVAAAADPATDLIIMPTAGREGVMDALRGSVTEQVVREASCPVLAIPILG